MVNGCPAPLYPPKRIILVAIFITGGGAGATLVRENETVLRFAAEAETINGPLTLFAVRAGAVATPFEPVITLALEAPPNVAEAPLPGAMNLTGIPVTGLPEESVTLAASAVPNIAPVFAD